MTQSRFQKLGSEPRVRSAKQGLCGSGALLEPTLSPQPVAGIRLKCSYEGTVGPPLLPAVLCNGDGNPCDLNRWSYRWLDTGSGEQTLTIWVNDNLDQFRIHPHNKQCGFHLREITLLVRATEPEPEVQPLLAPPFAQARAAKPVTVDRWPGSTATPTRGMPGGQRGG